MTHNKYWMVHNGLVGQAAKVMHTTYGAAAEEAKRLAEQHVGNTFFVLETTGYYSVEKPQASFHQMESNMPPRKLRSED